MNIAKFLKGTTTIGELLTLPNRYLQVFYKQYVNMIMDEEKKKAFESEQAGDEFMDMMT